MALARPIEAPPLKESMQIPLGLLIMNHTSAENM